MKTELTLSASVPIAFSTSEISNSEVGQTSGQWVKPKKISVGLPFRFCSVTACPAWSVSWNGPPIAAGAVTVFRPPIAHSMITSPTTRLAAKAAIITSGRIVRSIIDFLFAVSEAGRDAGGDHLEKHRGAVMEPQCRRAEHGQRAKGGCAPNNDRGHPALTRGHGHHSGLGGNRLSHAFQIGLVPGGRQAEWPRPTSR